jgi:hypothetical protein
MEAKTKGILVIIGGFILHLAIGCIYIWGNISIYVTSYLRHFDDSVTSESTFIVLPIHIMTSNIMIIVGSEICLRLGPRAATSIGGAVFTLGVFMSSFTEEFYTFVIVYSVTFGFGCGLIYLAPLLTAWTYFPKRKGLLSGVIVSGFGFGSAIFN